MTSLTTRRASLQARWQAARAQSVRSVLEQGAVLSEIKLGLDSYHDFPESDGSWAGWLSWASRDPEWMTPGDRNTADRYIFFAQMHPLLDAACPPGMPRPNSPGQLEPLIRWHEEPDTVVERWIALHTHRTEPLAQKTIRAALRNEAARENAARTITERAGRRVTPEALAEKLAEDEVIDVTPIRAPAQHNHAAAGAELMQRQVEATDALVRLATYAESLERELGSLAPVRQAAPSFAGRQVQIDWAQRAALIIKRYLNVA